MDVFKSEKALLEGVVDAMQALDPDIVLGFEVQKGSLGYLADRAATMEMGLLKLVSRTPEVLFTNLCCCCATASLLLCTPSAAHLQTAYISFGIAVHIIIPNWYEMQG